MGWKAFRDRLALILVVGIPTLWVVAGTTFIDLPAEALGATIVVWTLVAQFYFRKKDESEKTN